MLLAEDMETNMKQSKILALALGLAFAAGLVALPSRAEEIWQTLPPPPPMPNAEASGYAPVNNIKMYYAIYGQGEPLIMLHGGLAHSDVWGNQIPAFATHFKVVVADSRGHGRSTRSAQPYSYALMASDVIALMDYLRIDKAALVGWSDGGIIGLDIAMNHTGRLTKLYAFGANYNVAGLREDVATNATFNRYIEEVGKDYERLSPTPKEYDAFVKQIGEMWATQPDYTPEQLAGITVPTMVADGEHDEGIERAHTDALAELIPGAKLEILPGVSHFAFWQKPDEFNQSVLDFLLAPQ
jgi:pimeloyl-ACP methyl ester carboxylesterase